MKRRVSYWICQVLGWGAYSAVGIAMAAQQVGWLPSLVIGFALFFCYSIALTDLLRREIRRRSNLSSPRGWSWLILFLLPPALAGVQTFLVAGFNLALRQFESGAMRSRYPAIAFQPADILNTWISVTAADVVWLLLYLALTATRRFQEKELRLQLSLREAELRALEAQMNPHFLFNSLNSIRALVLEDPQQAQDMITRLANILRYNLHRDMNHTVPLASEVEVVQDYLALEAMRLEERLRVRMEIAPDAGRIPIPPMLLQALVENAIKHGISPRPEGGELVISAKLDRGGLNLQVDNPGRIAEPARESTKVGLVNTRERLRILYGSRASLDLRNCEGGGVAATVLIPNGV
jgi:signal transduction histidine kinase